MRPRNIVKYFALLRTNRRNRENFATMTRRVASVAWREWWRRTALQAALAEQTLWQARARRAHVVATVTTMQVFDDDNYLRIALQCGEVIWERGLSTKETSTFIPGMLLYGVVRTGAPRTELHAPDRPASFMKG
ncbi:hypothetical protein MSG28_003455 [Choristoneura fumiferana]|uniref:Uncharacterized protein n=1 Tax=Choristoneura fumiferana TaxID=7141 RepID=A0ACC0KFF0_CHOFU|nr:hypothetical protein MSG28_003455 [Choristoneura fumiferana]